jgi:hypothetical protein
VPLMRCGCCPSLATPLMRSPSVEPSPSRQSTLATSSRKIPRMDSLFFGYEHSKHWHYIEAWEKWQNDRLHEPYRSRNKSAYDEVRHNFPNEHQWAGEYEETVIPNEPNGSKKKPKAKKIKRPMNVRARAYAADLRGLYDRVTPRAARPATRVPRRFGMRTPRTSAAGASCCKAGPPSRRARTSSGQRCTPIPISSGAYARRSPSTVTTNLTRLSRTSRRYDSRDYGRSLRIPATSLRTTATRSVTASRRITSRCPDA